MCLHTLCCIYLWGNIKTYPIVDKESLSDCTKSLLLLKFTKAPFKFHLHLLKLQWVFFLVWMLRANPNHLFASWLWVVSQDPHNQCYECYKCFTFQPTVFSSSSNQSWVNIHDTMAAWSHFLLSNKAPVCTALFWASRAAVTTAFLLPVRLCIIFTDSTLIKWYAGGYEAGNVSKQRLRGRFINYDK